MVYSMEMRNAVFFIIIREWNMGSLCTMSFQKEHLLRRSTSCTSWKVLEIADKDNQTLKPCNLISILLGTLLLFLFVHKVEFRN